jgi:hypothetical protein
MIWRMVEAGSAFESEAGVGPKTQCTDLSRPCRSLTSIFFLPSCQGFGSHDEWRNGKIAELVSSHQQREDRREYHSSKSLMMRYITPEAAAQCLPYCRLISKEPPRVGAKCHPGLWERWKSMLMPHCISYEPCLRDSMNTRLVLRFPG